MSEMGDDDSNIEVSPDSSNNVRNVSHIIKQLESGKTAFRPPIGKKNVKLPSTTESSPSQPSSESSSPIPPPKFTYISSPMEITNRVAKSTDKSNNENHRQDVREDGPPKVLSKIPPVPPPKPNFNNTLTSEKNMPQNNRSGWVKINERWMPTMTEDGEPERRSSLENEIGDATTNGHAIVVSSKDEHDGDSKPAAADRRHTPIPSSTSIGRKPISIPNRENLSIANRDENSSTTNEDHSTNTDGQQRAAIADPTTTTGDQQGQQGQQPSISIDGSVAVFKKPLLPPPLRTASTSSIERRDSGTAERSSGSHSSSSPSLLRPLPPVPPHKPSLQSSSSFLATHRRNDPSTNSILSTTSSAQSISEDDSDNESIQRSTSIDRFPKSLSIDRGATIDGSTSTGGGDLPQTPTLTRAQKAQRLAEEFLTTEKSYVKTLEDLSENFVHYMDEQSKLINRPLVEPEIHKIIAQRLHEIRELHRILASDFQARLDNWSDDPRLADILLEKGPFLKMSIRFLQGKEDLAKEVIAASKKYPEFQTALVAFEKQNFDGLLLVHKLDSVHQRLCRYPLLLSSYLKYLDPMSAEYETAEKAKDFINGITLDLEKSLAQEDGTRKLSELYRRIVPQTNFEVIEPGRKLLKEGLILKYSRKERQQRHLILFTDVLICCAPMGLTGNLRVRHKFNLQGGTTSVDLKGENRDPDFPGYEFVVKGRQKSIIFITETQAEAKAWVKEINAAIDNGRRRSMAEFPKCGRDSGISNKSEESTAPPPIDNDQSPIPPARISPNQMQRLQSNSSSLGTLAPVWTPDQRVTMCQCCGLAFTTIRRRRHHCRACGRVICEECSGRAPLEYVNYKAERVCTYCYEIFYERTKDSAYLERMVDHLKLATSSFFLALFVAPKNRLHTDSSGGISLGSGSSDPNFESLAGARSRSSTNGLDALNDEYEDQVLCQGRLRVSKTNRQQCKQQYWAVARSNGVMEFYRAIEDKISEMKIVLLGWRVCKDDQDDTIFLLSHTNQLSAGGNSNDSSSMTYWLKTDTAEAAERWIENLEKFLSQFAS